MRIVKYEVVRHCEVDVDERDGRGRTALHHISCIEKIRAVLAAGVDPNSRDYDGSTPLHACADVDSDTRVYVDELLKAGADINATDTAGNTPVHIASAQFLHDIFDIALLSIDFDMRNKDGKTAAEHNSSQASTIRYAHEKQLKIRAATINAKIGAEFDAIQAQDIAPNRSRSPF